jgi:hypothetical protein
LDLYSLRKCSGWRIRITRPLVVGWMVIFKIYFPFKKPYERKYASKKFKLWWAKNNLSTIYLKGINWESMTWEGRTRITAKPCFHRFTYVATMSESFWTPLSRNISPVCCLARILLILVRIGNDSWCQTHPKVLIVYLVLFSVGAKDSL